MRRLLPSLLALALLPVLARAADSPIFRQSADDIDAFDFVELTVTPPTPVAGNPFRDATLTGTLQADKDVPRKVEGFCDDPAGRVFRIRFLALRPGPHTYTVEFRDQGRTLKHTGRFTARDARRRGPVRIDRNHPWHFLWSGTGEHYFWNATTTYWLLGWQDDDTIRQVIDRLARLQVNRIRVALCGRTTGGERWDEPQVVNTDQFHFRLNPWPAARPDAVDNPGFDVTRFNVPFWQKAERLLRHARDRDVIVSVIFFLDGRDPGVDPFGKAKAGGDDEQRYYRYGLARHASFSNVMWDVTNEYHLFRDEPWVERMAKLIKSTDPYGHLLSVHGHGEFRFRTSPWVDFAMYQSWDEAGGHAFMLKNRQLQAKTGRPMPQVNEEYGYEDHYPTRWGGGKKPPARSADNRRRLAWGIVMAGGYQTTGERADRGTGKPPDTGGGWINGRGDDAMTMLTGYAHMVACFEQFRWWTADPRDDLVNAGAFCLAEPGRQYLVYLPAGKPVTVQLEGGPFRARWFNPRTGAWTELPPARGPAWTSPTPADAGDWALLLRD